MLLLRDGVLQGSLLIWYLSQELQCLNHPKWVQDFVDWPTVSTSPDWRSNSCRKNPLRTRKWVCSPLHHPFQTQRKNRRDLLPCDNVQHATKGSDTLHLSDFPEPQFVINLQQKIHPIGWNRRTWNIMELWRWTDFYHKKCTVSWSFSLTCMRMAAMTWSPQGPTSWNFLRCTHGVPAKDSPERKWVLRMSNYFFLFSVFFFFAAMSWISSCVDEWNNLGHLVFHKMVMNRKIKRMYSVAQSKEGSSKRALELLSLPINAKMFLALCKLQSSSLPTFRKPMSTWHTKRLSSARLSWHKELGSVESKV